MSLNTRKVLRWKSGFASLEEWLFKRRKVFSPEEIYRIGSQLFDILKYLHGRNVVHGDVSAANLLYDGEKLSLLDFGLARYADGRNIRFSIDYARTANVRGMRNCLSPKGREDFCAG